MKSHSKVFVIFCAFIPLLVTACSKKSAAGGSETSGSGKYSNLSGVYETRSDGRHMMITVDLRDGGSAKTVFAFPPSQDDPEGTSFASILKKNIARGFTLEKATWTVEGKLLRIQKTINESVPKTNANGEINDDTVPLTHTFTIQENGDLIFQKDGLRLYRVR